MTAHLQGRSRWLALVVLCLGDLMIVLDSTVVNVALPSIRSDLGFAETSLVWVVNAYLLTFGGFLLLGGRLGDLYGHRKLFLYGIVGFTLASLACGLATSQTLLIVARAIQGLGGAVVSAVALSLIVLIFTEDAERAKAMGVFSLGLSARLVTRFGIRAPLGVGLLLAAAGLALFARAPADGAFWIDVMPGMTLLGLGAGIAFNPILLAAMNDVGPHESGLASGIVNTSFMMGGALGLAILAALSAAETAAALAGGAAMPAALNEGYRLAFLVGAVCAAVAGALAFLLRRPSSSAEPAGTPAPAEAE